MAEYFAGGHLRFVNGEWRDDNGDAIEFLVCGMGGGNAASLVLFAGKIDLKDLTLIYGRIGNHTTAPTAVRRWTEVTVIALWHKQDHL